MKPIGLFTATGVAIALSTLATPADSRPYPDRLGICYFFRGDTQDLTQPCVISSGYGAGAHYAVLLRKDGVRTSIQMINACPDGNYDEQGFCRYLVDDHEAMPYYRDTFMNVTTTTDDENLSCFRVMDTGKSVCYRFNYSNRQIG
jgi:hypothetical protein